MTSSKRVMIANTAWEKAKGQYGRVADASEDHRPEKRMIEEVTENGFI